MQTDREKILEGVGYRWWMYRCSRHLIMTGSIFSAQGTIVHNAASCSSYVHARALADFFYDGPKRETDWTAEDLGMTRIPPPAPIRALREHVNKHVVHITQGVSSEFEIPSPMDVEACFRERIDALKAKLGSEIGEMWVGNVTVKGWPETVGGRPFKPGIHVRRV